MRDQRVDGLESMAQAFPFFAVPTAIFGVSMLPHGRSVAAGAIAGLLVLAYSLQFLKHSARTLTWVWVFVVLQTPIASLVGYDGSAGRIVLQADDGLVALSLALVLGRLAFERTQATVQLSAAVRYTLAFLGTIGLASSVLHGRGAVVSLAGAWLALKLWTLIFICTSIPWNARDRERTWRIFSRVGLVVSAFAVVDLVARAPLRAFLHTDAVSSDYRATDAVQSIFTTPGRFSFCMVALFAVALTRFFVLQSRSALVFALIFAFSDLLSLRLKGVLGLVAVVAVVAVATKGNRARVLPAALLIFPLIALPGAVIVGSTVQTQLSTYSSSNDTARGLIYSTSSKVAKDYFPLGAGWGQYGGFEARDHYSPLYDTYGLSRVYGLSKDNPQFLTDTSWPSVLGESGVFGLGAYVLALVALVVSLWRRRTTGVELHAVVALGTMAALLVDSAGNPTLFDAFAAFTAGLLVGMALPTSGADQL